MIEQTLQEIASRDLRRKASVELERVAKDRSYSVADRQAAAAELASRNGPPAPVAQGVPDVDPETQQIIQESLAKLNAQQAEEDDDFQQALPEVVLPEVEVVAAFPWSKLHFGYAMQGGAIVKIYAGVIKHGTRAEVAVVDTNVTFTANLQWCWIDYTIGTSGVIGGPALTVPANTSTHAYCGLFQFTFTAPNVTGLNAIGHLGDWIIPGLFA